MRVLVNIIILLVVIASTGCLQIPIDIGSSVETAYSPTITELPEKQNQAMSTPDRSDETMTKVPKRVVPTVAITPVIGEVPSDLLDSILKDLSERSSISLEKISVIQAQEIIWNDGSLGCPLPGVMYTQALVRGFRVILEIGDQRYDYHAAENGYYFLCPNSLPSIPPPGTPNS